MLSVPTSLDVFTQLEELEKFRPDLLIIFPSVLKEYVSIWGSGKRNPLQLKVIRTLGETLSDEVRKMAGEATGANVLDTYSSSEVGRIATQVSPEGVYTVNNYSLIVEVLDEGGKRCKPDEIGRVVITDLFNFATPLVRYDIGDWAIPADDFHHTLSSIKGRSRNMISLPNGNKVWPLVGYREFSEVVPIRQFHIRQTSPEALQANFFVESTPSEKDEESLRKIICESLGYGFTITFAYQNAPLKKLPNQKLEDFVSLV
jgi:phenylacetate-CoA ligase